MNRRSPQPGWTPPLLEGPFEAAFGSSVLEEIVGGYTPSDVLTELVQNEYDAGGSRLEISFGSDRLTVTGNGKVIDPEGWDRLSVLLGTGRVVGSAGPERTVVPKQNGIGSKNFGLRSLFLYGDVIYVCSGGRQMVLNLRKLGTQACEDGASLRRPGVQIYVPYRTEALGNLEPFPAERERQALSTIVEDLQLTLLKLSHPGTHKSLREVIVNSQRFGRRIGWKQSAKRISCRHRGVSAVRRRVTVLDATSSETRASKPLALEEIEFQKTFPVPPFTDVSIPGYFRSPAGKIRIGVSFRMQRDKLKIGELGIFYYPLGVHGRYTGSGVSLNAPFQMDSDRSEMLDNSWNRLLLDWTIGLIFELLPAEWRRWFGGDAYLALEQRVPSAPTWFAQEIERRLREDACWPTRARDNAGSRKLVLANASDLVVPTYPDLDKFLGDQRYLDDRMGTGARVQRLVRQYGANEFTVNSLVRLRCAGNSSSLATKLGEGEAKFYFGDFPKELKDEDLQVRIARALDRQSKSLSRLNKRDLQETPTTLAADGSLQAAKGLYAVDSTIADVCPVPPPRRLHPSLLAFRTVARLCRKFDVSGWACDVAQRAIDGTASEVDRRALYNYIRSHPRELLRKAVNAIRQAPVVLDHREMWTRPQDITLRSAAMASAVEPALHFPHPEDVNNSDLARRLRFRRKVEGKDLVAFARLVSERPEVAEGFEETLDRLHRTLTPRVVEQMRQIPFLQSSKGGLKSPSTLYQKTRLTLGCLGSESPFVSGSRTRLYRRLGCLDRPQARDVVAHLAHLRSQGLPLARPEVLYPALVEALKRENLDLALFKEEPILWTGEGYSRPDATLVGLRIPRCFLGAVACVRGPSVLSDAFRALGGHGTPGEQHWCQLFSWIGEKYRRVSGPVRDEDRRALREAYRLRGRQGVPHGLASDVPCLLSWDGTLHTLDEVRVGRYVLDDDPPLAEAAKTQGASIALAEVSDTSHDFLSALGARSLTEISGQAQAEIGPERTPPPWFDGSQTLARLHASEFASALAGVAREHFRRRAAEAPPGAAAIAGQLQAVTGISFVQEIKRIYRIAGTPVSVNGEVWLDGDSVFLVWVRGRDELNELLAQALACLLGNYTAADRHELADRIFRLLACASPHEMARYLRRRGIPWQPLHVPAEPDDEDRRQQAVTVGETLTQQLLEASEPESTPPDKRPTPRPSPKAPEKLRQLPPIGNVRPLRVLEPTRGLEPTPVRVRGRRSSPIVWTPPGPRDVEWDRMVGQRGEELVYKYVRERAHPQSQVVWTAKADPAADHDIRSVHEDGKDLWIEVKSTTGRDGKFTWQKAEFEKALREGDHYELWRVYEAHTVNPTAKRFRNPIRLLGARAIRFQIGSLSAEVEPLGVRSADSDTPVTRL